MVFHLKKCLFSYLFKNLINQNRNFWFWWVYTNLNVEKSEQYRQCPQIFSKLYQRKYLDVTNNLGVSQRKDHQEALKTLIVPLPTYRLNYQTARLRVKWLYLTLECFPAIKTNADVRSLQTFQSCESTNCNNSKQTKNAVEFLTTHCKLAYYLLVSSL